MDKSSIPRKLAAAAVVAFGVALLAFILSCSPPGNEKDFTEYWAAGKLLLAHANPYDGALVLQTQVAAGIPVQRPQIMFNLPNAMLFALPLGLLSVRWAVLVWTLLVVGSLLLSVRVLWVLNGRQTDRTHLLCYVFAPVVTCATLGQIVPLALLGLVLFLWQYEKRPFLAGFSIALFTVKPHLLIPFALIALVWVLQSKRYRLLVGAVTGFATACLLPLAFRPSLFVDYLPTFRRASNYRTPNLSAGLHALLPFPGTRYLLLTLACVWAVWFYRQHQTIWHWNREGLLLITVSVAAAPYSWFFDEVLVLPAILAAIYASSDALSLRAFAVIDVLALVPALFGVPVDTRAYVWTSTAWLCWYCWVRQRTAESPLLLVRVDQSEAG